MKEEWQRKFRERAWEKKYNALFRTIGKDKQDLSEENASLRVQLEEVFDTLIRTEGALKEANALGNKQAWQMRQMMATLKQQSERREMMWFRKTLEGARNKDWSKL